MSEAMGTMFWARKKQQQKTEEGKLARGKYILFRQVLDAVSGSSAIVHSTAVKAIPNYNHHPHWSAPCSAAATEWTDSIFSLCQVSTAILCGKEEAGALEWEQDVAQGFIAEEHWATVWTPKQAG